VRKERPEKKNVPMMLRTRLAKTKSQHANEQNCQMPNSTKIVLRIVHKMFAPRRSSKIRNDITLCTMKVLREGHVYLQRLVSFRLAARKILDSHTPMVVAFCQLIYPHFEAKMFPFDPPSWLEASVQKILLGKTETKDCCLSVLQEKLLPSWAVRK
jgi:hypothetical protein